MASLSDETRQEMENLRFARDPRPDTERQEALVRGEEDQREIVRIAARMQALEPVTAQVAKPNIPEWTDDVRIYGECFECGAADRPMHRCPARD